MASLVANEKSESFENVAVAADAAGDTYPADPLVTFWVSNQGILPVTVTVKEKRTCNHPHHGLVDREVTVAASALQVIEAQDVRFMAGNDRRVSVEYDQVSEVYVAAFMGY